MYHAIGLYGRLCLRAGLGERGREAITLAIHRGVATSSDRAQLASYYFEKKQFEEALKVLRSVGLTKGEFSWQALRLNILVALNRTEEIVYQAHQVLSQNPEHEIALKALETYR